MFEDGAGVDDAGRMRGASGGKFMYCEIRDSEERNDEDGCFC